MAGGFGFARYPQSKTPDSRAVGAALQQQGQGPSDPMMGHEQGEAMMAAAPPPVDPAAQMRAAGAERMTAPGQMDDHPQSGDAHSSNALSIAVGEALTRQGGGYATNPNPYKPRESNIRLLMQNGLSEVEARLLSQTGGV